VKHPDGVTQIHYRLENIRIIWLKEYLLIIITQMRLPWGIFGLKELLAVFQQAAPPPWRLTGTLP
jgi:hypothetical protein